MAIVKGKLHIDASGPDGNIFAIMSKVKAMLDEAGWEKESKRMVERVTKQASYEAAIAVIKEYVNIELVY